MTTFLGYAQADPQYLATAHRVRRHLRGGRTVIRTEYLGREHGLLRDCDGSIVGSYHETARWETPRSWISTTMMQVVVVRPADFDGPRVWTARTHGDGMAVTGKPKAL